MKLKSQILWLGLVSFTVAACGEAATDDAATIRQALQADVDQTAVPLGDAACAALAAAGEGAVLIEAEYELADDEDGEPAGYEVELHVGGVEREFLVDPQTGGATEEVDEDDDTDEQPEPAPAIMLDCDGAKAAIAAAEGETGGTAFELEVEDLIEVETIQNAEVWEVELDADLNVLSSELEDDWDGSEDEDDEDGEDGEDGENDD